MGSRDEVVAKVATITGVSVPVALELVDAAGGDLQTALHIFETSRISMPRPNVNRAASFQSHFQPPSFQSAAMQSTAPPLQTSYQALTWVDALKKQAAEIAETLLLFEAQGSLFTDSLFPADRSSLGACHGADEVVSWRRPREFLRGAEPLLFKDTMAPSDVIQGRLQDCWFLGALSIVASKPGLLQRNLEFAWVHKGVYLVRFWVAGEWIPCVVDDLIPCSAAGTPIFGRCQDPRHVWVPVVSCSPRAHALVTSAPRVALFINTPVIDSRMQLHD